MKINVNEKQSIEFLIEIEGANIDEITPRLVIADSDYSIAIDGNMRNDTEGQKCEFVIPKLSHLVKKESAQARIEIFFKDKYLIPWSDEIELDRPIDVKLKESSNAPKKSESIKIKSVSPMQKKVKSVISLGDIVEKFSNDSITLVEAKRAIYKRLTGSERYQNFNEEAKAKIDKLKLVKTTDEELFEILENISTTDIDELTTIVLG